MERHGTKGDAASEEAQVRRLLRTRWKYDFAATPIPCVPEPVSHRGVMGRMTPLSIVRVLRAVGPLSERDVLVDLGMGDGGFLAAAAYLGVRAELRGVEVDEHLFALAAAKLAHVARARLARRDIRELASLSDATVVYVFCDAMRVDTLEAIAWLTRCAPALRAAVLVPRPREHTAVSELCLEAEFKLPVSKAGAGRYTAYVWRPRRP